MPAPAVVIPTITGSSREDVKLFGPVQLYVAPPIVFAVKLKLYPAQTGLLLPAIGAEGVALMVTDVVAVELVQPATVTLTE